MGIDSFIIFTYLLITLLYGLYVGRGVKNINDYALGGRNFSTPILAATIFATYASASGFFINTQRSYEDGLYKFFATFGQTIGLLFLAYFIAPRMKEFFGKLSGAEILGTIYGKKVRVISSITILIVSSGFLGVQIKVIASLLSNFISWHPNMLVVLVAMIVTFYSAVGGVRSVTLTDFIQFATFGIAIPMIFISVLTSVDFLTYPDRFDQIIKHSFNFDEAKFNYYFVLFFYFMTPGLNGPLIQRMLMAKNSLQIKNSFFIASCFLILSTFLICMTGIMLKVTEPNLAKNDIIPYLLNNYTSAGFKAIFIIGVIALAMSTADSFLNSGAVSFAHDFCIPTGIISEKNELLASKLFTVICGIIGILFALNFNDLLDLILFVYSFDIPIVTVPLVLALFGFRSSERAVLVGITFAVITVLFWDSAMKYLGFINPIAPFIPGMIAHMIGLFGSHYIFGEKGGWGQGPGQGLFNSPSKNIWLQK